VIPARGGSKRIPNKNTRELGGRPLIAYSIAAAVESGLFSQVVVSTDSEEIAAIALQYGADVPFLRQASLADDQTPVSLATCDALEKLDPGGSRFDAVAQLMANCPLRTASDVVDSYQQFKHAERDVQISVCRYGWLNPWWAMTRGPGLEVEPLFEDQLRQRSQDLPDLYCPTGAIWWAKSSVLRSQRTFHVSGRTGWEIPWERALDIDDEDDWRMAEVLFGLHGNAG